MARVTQIQWYYHVQCLLFLFLTIYSFVFVSTYSDDKCYVVQSNSTRLLFPTNENLFDGPRVLLANTTDSSIALDNLSTRILQTNATDNSTTSSSSSTECEDPGTAPKTSLTVVAGILGFVYASLAGLMCFMSLFIYYFSNLDISEFADLSFCQNCMGKLTKCIPYLVILGHLLALILVITQLFMVYVVKNCVDACHLDDTTGELEKGLMQSEAEVLIIVCSFAWIVMHIAGGLLRRSVYYDAFFYQPEIRVNKCMLWCCTRCGP